MKTNTVSERAAGAFLSGLNFMESTTHVAVNNKHSRIGLFLNGTLIAKRDEIEQIYFKVDNSITTAAKNRLNAILAALGEPLIDKVEGKLFWDNGIQMAEGWNALNETGGW